MIWRAIKKQKVTKGLFVAMGGESSYILVFAAHSGSSGRTIMVAETHSIRTQYSVDFSYAYAAPTTPLGSKISVK